MCVSVWHLNNPELSDYITTAKDWRFQFCAKKAMPQYVTYVIKMTINLFDFNSKTF